jgi:hypothetical protein
MKTCPKCGHDKISTERRMNGNHICQKCRNVWPNKREEPSGNSEELKRYDALDACFVTGGRYVLFIEVQDAIAERDGRIRELEAMVERLKNCWNCKNSDVRCSYYEGPCCERWEIE